MPYIVRTSIPLRAALMRTPGDLGPLPMLVAGAAQLNRPAYPGLGAIVTPISPYALGRRVVTAVSPYALGGRVVTPVSPYALGRVVTPVAPWQLGGRVVTGGMPRRFLGDGYTDRPWRNLAQASISGSFGSRLGYYEALVPRVGTVRSARAGLSGYYRIDLAG